MQCILVVQAPSGILYFQQITHMEISIIYYVKWQ